MFGASKDLCASGLRLGCLHSRNAALNQALVNLAYFCLPSSAVQWAFARLLGDGAWLAGFVAENARRLRASYEALTGALDALAAARGGDGGGSGCDGADGSANGSGGGGGHVNGSAAAAPPPVPLRYTPARAAMFLWLDCRAALRAPTWDEEAALWRRMVDDKKLLLTPGQACHAAEPGFFRICWAWMPAEALPVAVARIAAACAEHRAGVPVSAAAAE